MAIVIDRLDPGSRKAAEVQPRIIMPRIVPCARFRNINRVVYGVAPKPPGTIERE